MKFFKLLSNQGIRWFLYRSQYEIKKNLGILEHTYPEISFDAVEIGGFSLENDFINFFEIGDVEDFLNDKTRRFILNEADLLLNNKFRYFSSDLVEVNPLNWHYNYFNKRNTPKDLHWSKISDLNSDFGDIKEIWEIARFSYVYTLAKAYVITKNEKYAKKIWDLFGNFFLNNPPEKGIHYKCGQEMSFRLLALWYAANLTKTSHSFNEEVKLNLLKMIIQHTRHIYKHLNFSVEAVKNNHSISEATLLFTMGCLFSSEGKESLKWKLKGLKTLEKEISWQIYDDGSYIQHSHNYHRLVLQNLTFVKLISNKYEVEFSNSFNKKVKKSINFLINHCDTKSGRVPNYGMNDGAYLFPDSNLKYLDYAPALNACNQLYNGNIIFEREDSIDILFWLGIIKKNNYALDEKVQKVKSRWYEQGGYLISVKGKQRLMTRCTTYKHRPAQSDMLHVDYWIGENNILADAGTYSYNTNKEILLYFNGSKSHNSLYYNSRDQMIKGDRFLWYDWTKSKLLDLNLSKEVDYFQGTHFSYKEITYIRTLKHEEKLLLIEDHISNNETEGHFEFYFLLGVPISKFFEEKNKFYLTLSDSEEISLEFSSNEEFQLEVEIGEQSLYYDATIKRTAVKITFKTSKNDFKLKTFIKKEERNCE